MLRPPCAGIGFRFANFQGSRNISGAHVELLRVIEPEIDGRGAWGDVHNRKFLASEVYKPEAHEVAQIWTEHCVEYLREMILEAVARLAAERLIVVFEAKRFPGIVHPQHELSSVRIQESRDAFHRHFFQLAVYLLGAVIEPKRGFKFQPLMFFLRDEFVNSRVRAGQLVRELDLGELAGGFDYYAAWDGKNEAGVGVSAGPYYALFFVGGARQTGTLKLTVRGATVGRPRR